MKDKNDKFVRVKKSFGGCRNYDCENYPHFDIGSSSSSYNECCKMCVHFKPYNFHERKETMKTRSNGFLLRRK